LFLRIGSLLTLVALLSCGESGSAVPQKYVEAKLLYAQGRIDEAVRDLEALVAQAGSFAPARLLYGRALYFQGDYDRAGTVLTALRGDHPESVEASLWLVRTLVSKDRPAEAEQLLVRLLAVNPDDPRLAYQMALIRVNRNDLPGALGFLRAAATADEDLALIHYEAARVSFQLHDGPTARAELAQALGFLSPGSLLREPIERLQRDLGSEKRP